MSVERGCILCGVKGPTVVTLAHAHDDVLSIEAVPPRYAQSKSRRATGMGTTTRAFPLCWTCHHGYYDCGVVTTAELLVAEEAWFVRGVTPDPTAVHRRIEAEIASGQRSVRHLRAEAAVAKMREKRQSPA